MNAAAGIGEKDILPPAATGSPVTGGTLKIVGSGDVDHLDTCCAYYTTTYELLRAVSRQLVSYQSGYTTRLPPHRSRTWPPTRSVPNGLTYTFKIKQGVMWDAPDRARPGHLPRRGARTQATLQPGPARSADRLLGGQHRRHEVVLHGLRRRSRCRRARPPRSLRSRTTSSNHQISGLSTPNSSTLDITLDAPVEQLHQHHGDADELAGPRRDPPVPARLGSRRAALHLRRSVHDHLVHAQRQLHARRRTRPGSRAPTRLRHQYFDAIDITMGENPTTIQQAARDRRRPTSSGTPPFRPPTCESLTSSPQFVAGYIGGITYLVFNMKQHRQRRSAREARGP